MILLFVVFIVIPIASALFGVFVGGPLAARGDKVLFLGSCGAYLVLLVCLTLVLSGELKNQQETDKEIMKNELIELISSDIARLHIIFKNGVTDVRMTTEKDIKKLVSVLTSSDSSIYAVNISYLRIRKFVWGSIPILSWSNPLVYWKK